MTSLPGCMREVTDCGLSELRRKIVLRLTPENAGSLPGIQRHLSG